MSGEGMVNALDSYFETALLANLGSAGSYTTLVVQEVFASDRYVDEARKKPFVVAVNNNAQNIQFGQTYYTGTSKASIDAEYPYWLVAVVEGNTREVARQNALTLLYRIREWLRSNKSLGGTSYGSEQIRQLQLSGDTWEVVPGRGGSASQHIGIAALGLTIITEADS